MHDGLFAIAFVSRSLVRRQSKQRFATKRGTADDLHERAPLAVDAQGLHLLLELGQIRRLLGSRSARGGGANRHRRNQRDEPDRTPQDCLPPNSAAGGRDSGECYYWSTGRTLRKVSSPTVYFLRRLR